MATMSLTVDATPIRARVEKFIDFFTEQLDEQNNIYIADLFILLPINPRSDATRRRLERRETINVEGNKLSVQAPPEDNRDFRGTFIDGLGNLGRVVVTFEKTITASTSKSNGNLVVDFGQSAIPVRVSALAAHPQLGRDQALYKIEVLGHEKIMFYFRDRRKPSLEVEVAVSLQPQEAQEADRVGPLSAFISKSLRASSRTALLMAEASKDDGCGGGGDIGDDTGEDIGDDTGDDPGSSTGSPLDLRTAIIEHPDASTDFYATEYGCTKAEEVAMARCVRWANNNGKDACLCEKKVDCRIY